MKFFTTILLIALSFLSCNSQTFKVYIGGTDIYCTILDKIEKTCMISSNRDLSPSYYRELDLPSTVEYENTTYTVVAIGKGAFAHDNIKKIELPNTLISIGDSAFCSCSKLHTITIPKNVTFIGNKAFEDCSLQISWKQFK